MPPLVRVTLRKIKQSSLSIQTLNIYTFSYYVWSVMKTNQVTRSQQLIQTNPLFLVRKKGR